MRKTKLAQKKQFPPAPLWRAVFDTLKDRTPSERPQLVGLPTKAQYEAIALILGQSLGELGQVDIETLTTMAAMLSLNSVADVEQINDSDKALMQTVFDTVFNIGEIDVEGVLAYQVRHPAKAFLRTQKVYMMQGEEAMAPQEPLFLDNLTTYKIKEFLINEMNTAATDTNEDKLTADTSMQTLMYQKIIPAGVARQTTLPNQQQKLQQHCLEFQEQLIANGFYDANKDEAEDNVGLTLLTPTSEHPVQIELAALLNPNADSNHHSALLLKLLPKAIKMKGLVPIASHKRQSSDNPYKAGMSYAEQSPKQWFNILPNSASPKHLLKFWLSHLYWQVARRTTAEQVALNEGISIWRFNKSSSHVKGYEKVTAFKLAPIVYEDAVIELIKWAIFAKLSGQVPIALLPEYALSYLDKCQKKMDDNNENSSYWPTRADFSEWIRPGFHTDTIYDTCSQHATWQYVLRDQEVFKALSVALTILAEPLYGPMFNALECLEG